MVKGRFGVIMSYYRERYGLQQSALYEGVCSAASYFRVEMGERMVDFVIIEALLSRICKSSEQFEFMMKSEDYDLWTKRLEMQSAMMEQDFLKVDKEIKEYKKQMPLNSNLHRQFCLYCELKVAEWNRQPVDILCQIAWSALAITKNIGDKPHKRKNLYSNTEMDLLLTLIHYKYEKWGEYNNAKTCLIEMLEMIEMCPPQKAQISVEGKILMELAAVIEKHDDDIILYEYIDKAIDTSSKSDGIVRLAELHFMKARLLWRIQKGLGIKDGWLHLCEEECRMAYGIFLVMEREKEKEEVEKFCKEELNWHITMQIE
ncbi:MAG: hypothetical protein HFH82_08040 [Lachnospiraceae bacterium]|nr:hypothetical protein [Lachnospiraceae bacterium]